MKDGKCIKCGSREVYHNNGRWGQRGGFNGNTIPVTVFTDAELTNFVCVNCGYVENYIQDGKKREKIKGKWTKV